MAEKCKILFGLESAEGGALRHLIYLVTNLDQKKFDITVVFSDRRAGYVQEHIESMTRLGIRVLIISMDRSIHPFHDLKAFIRIFRHMAGRRYDIVHAHSSKAGVLFRLAAWLCGVGSIIYTPHCFYFQSRKGLRRSFFIGIEKMLSFITHHIIVSHNEKAQALLHRVAGPEKLVDINNSIRLDEKFDKREIGRKRVELGIRADDIVVGAVGRLTRQKDWPTFILAAKETYRAVKNVVFLIVGEGEELERINGLIEELELKGKVITAGYRKDIGNIYNLIDIYINTSLWEGLPYVLVEAMWFRKPIIATNLNYGAIIRNSESGYLVETRDYKVMASRIIQLVNSRQLRRRMGRAGHRLSRRHLSFKKFICRHEALYLRATV